MGDFVKISLVYSPGPRRVCEWVMELALGSTVAQAISACGVLKEFPELQAACLKTGIWGQKNGLTHVLNNLDRVEIYRGLQVDPKVARRERFNRQGVKTAGLFTRTRAGAKAGY